MDTLVTVLDHGYDDSVAVAAVAHGVAHLLLLVADARNLPGVRAAPGTRRRGWGARRHRGTGEIDVGL